MGGPPQSSSTANPSESRMHAGAGKLVSALRVEEFLRLDFGITPTLQSAHDLGITPTLQSAHGLDRARAPPTISI